MVEVVRGGKVGTSNATTKNVQWLYPENLLGRGHDL